METRFSRDFSNALSTIDVKWLNKKGHSLQSQLFQALPDYILTNYFTPASTSLMFASSRDREIEKRRIITSMLTVKSLTSQLNAIFQLAQLLESALIIDEFNRLTYYYMTLKPYFLESPISSKLKARYNKAASNYATANGLIHYPKFE